MRNKPLKDSHHFQNALPTGQGVRRKRRRFSIFHRFLALVFIAAGVSLGYFYFGPSTRPIPEEELPIISADRYDGEAEKMRVEESEPTGATSKNSSIYSELETGTPKKEGATEQLLTPPEAPQFQGNVNIDQPEIVPPGYEDFSVEEPMDGIETSVESSTKTLNSVVANNHEPQEGTPESAEFSAALSAKSRKTLQQVLDETDQSIARQAGSMIIADMKGRQKLPPLRESTNDHIEIVKKNSETVQKSRVENAAGVEKTFFVQLGSFKTEAEATHEQVRLLGLRAVKHSLGNTPLTIRKIDLGKEKGVWHCLFVGPLDQAKADMCCDKLKDQRLNCQVRPLSKE